MIDFFAEFGGLQDILYVREEHNVVADWISRPPALPDGPSVPQVYSLRIVGSEFLDELKAALPRAIGPIRATLARNTHLIRWLRTRIR